jgi:hypothetical protein
MSDPHRFDGAVFREDGEPLGEARFWAGPDWDGDEQPWRGWLRPADLGLEQLPRGRYRVRARAGWEAWFAPVGPAARVFESDLVPLRGEAPLPWPEEDEQPAALLHRPGWGDTPARGAPDQVRLRLGSAAESPPGWNAPAAPAAPSPPEEPDDHTGDTPERF